MKLKLLAYTRNKYEIIRFVTSDMKLHFLIVLRTMYSNASLFIRGAYKYRHQALSVRCSIRVVSSIKYSNLELEVPVVVGTR